MTSKDRREQIIEEAIGIIHNYGYSGLSIRELAGNVGISEAAIYRHFESKEDIIRGIFDKINSFSAALYESIDNHNDAKIKLKNFISFNLEMFEKNPHLVSIIFSDEIFISYPSISKELLHILKKRQILLLKIIEDGISKKLIIKAEAEVISMMIQGYIRLLIIKWKQSGFKFSLKQKGKDLDRHCTLLGGLFILCFHVFVYDVIRLEY